MQKLIVSLLFLSITGFAFASDPQEIIDIRARYQDVGNWITQGKLFVNEITLNKNKKLIEGVGLFVSTIKFYYAPVGMLDEESDVLVKVEVYQEYINMRFVSEFFYDNNQKLLFCYKKDWSIDGYTQTFEKRYYFHGESVIRLLEGTQTVDPNDDLYEPLVRGVWNESEYYVSVFNSIIDEW